MMSEREANETAKYGEVLRWSSDSGEDESPQHVLETDQPQASDSEGPTELGVMMGRVSIPETQAELVERSGEVNHWSPEREEVEGDGSHWTIEARAERFGKPGQVLAHGNVSSQCASPCISEFESYLA
jgi:hypothetical protein